MYADTQNLARVRQSQDDAVHALDWRIGLLKRRLQRLVRRLREPSAHWIRFPVGVLFILGGIFGILPVLGLCMLPLGLAVLAEDVPPLRRAIERDGLRLTLSRRKFVCLRGQFTSEVGSTLNGRALGRVLIWIERRRPHWLGLPRHLQGGRKTEVTSQGDPA